MIRLWPRRKVFLDNLPKTHDLRFALIFILVMATVLGSLYGVGYVVAGDKVPRGTTVADVEIGNLTRGEAETVLRQRLIPRLQRPVTVEYGADDFPLDLQEAGVTLDVEATVDEAAGGTDWDPRHMFAVLVGGGEIDPVVDVDRADLRRSLGPVIRAAHVEPVDSTVSFRDGRPAAIAGSVGTDVDLERMQARLAAALRDDVSTVQAPVADVRPDVSTAEARRFADSVARRAVSGSIRLSTERSEVVVPPEQFASALRAVESDGRLRLGIDSATASRLGAPSRAQLPGQPANARIVLRDDRVVVLPGEAGFSVTEQAWSEGVLTAALGGEDGNRSARLALVERQPAFTTDEARALRVTRRVGQYVVRFPASLDRAQVRRIAAGVDGVLIKPGARLSFLSRVELGGEPRAAEVVATATYNTALLAGLDVVARAHDRSRRDYLPVGRDALVRRPAPDLVLENQVPHGVLLASTVERTTFGGLVRVEAWSTPHWRVTLRTSKRQQVFLPEPIRRAGPRCERRLGRAGFTVEVTRVRERGDQRQQDTFASSYSAERGVVCGVRAGARLRP